MNSSADGRSETQDATGILFVSHTGVVGGGAEVVLEQVITCSKGPGYRHLLAVPSGPLESRLAGLVSKTYRLALVPPRRTRNLRRVISTCLSWLRTTVQLWSVIKKERPALVYANSGVAALICAGACRLRGVPLVWHQHDIIPNRWVNRIVLRTLLGHCRNIVTVSKPVAESLTNLGFQRSSIRIVNNGVRKEYFDPLPDRDESRTALGLPAEIPLVALAGRLVPYKGHRMFLEALAELRATGVDVVGAIAGSVPPYEPPDVDPFPGYHDELRHRAAAPDLAGRVFFIEQQPDLRRLLAASDLLAVPSIDEPFPLIVLEAMAAGVAVVASDSGGHPEAIENGVGGRLFHSGDSGALAEALREVIQDSALRARYGQCGRDRATAMFSQERFCRDILSVMVDAAGTGKSGRRL